MDLTFIVKGGRIQKNMVRDVQTFLVEKTFFVHLEERSFQDERLARDKSLNMVITISRQHGCYGAETAIELQKLLDQGWIVFHKEILEAISKNSGVEQQYIEQFDEKTLPFIDTIVSGFNKPYLTDTSYFNHLRKFLFSLSERGKVIIVGRGANFVLKQGFHVRLIAPKAIRLKNLMDMNNYSRNEAEKEIEESDKHRRNYIKKMFDAEVDDPNNYDLVINMKDLNYKETARLIYDATQISAIFQ